MKKTAFTLMEILLALAIVGVVAVLTIPNLIGETTSKVSATTLKSTYSQLGDAFKQAMIDQNVVNVVDLEFSGTGNSQKLSSFLRKYLDASKDCGSTISDCFASSYKSYNGTLVTNPFTINGKTFNEAVILSNGAALALYIDFAAQDVKNMYIMIDTNGSQKPNTFGKDTFALKIFENGDLGDSFNSTKASSFDSACKGHSDASAARACFTLLNGKGWDIDSYLD